MLGCYGNFITTAKNHHGKNSAHRKILYPRHIRHLHLKTTMAGTIRSNHLNQITQTRSTTKFGLA